MTAPTLKLVPDTLDHDLAEIEGDILAATRDALIKRKKGDTDVLPPSARYGGPKATPLCPADRQFFTQYEDVAA